jgi:hypothetical protein
LGHSAVEQESVEPRRSAIRALGGVAAEIGRIDR